MLFFVRVVALVIFSALVGICANWINGMCADGSFFEAFNSDRRASITLLSASLLGVVSLSGFEVSLLMKRWRSRQRDNVDFYGDEEDVDASPDIYALPKTDAGWVRSRRHSSSKKRSSRSQHRSGAGERSTSIWLAIINVYAVLLPVLYLLLFAGCLYLKKDTPIILTALALMLLLSVLVAIGLFRRSAGGLILGLFVSVIHLVIFPIGTFVGLVFLLALIGSSASFRPSKRQRGRNRSASSHSFAR